MAKSTTELKTFNRGLISRLALARNDVDRTAMSADVMTNWMPRRLGSMMLRPGTQYIGSTASNNAGKLVPFIYSTSDTALLEFTASLMRVWVDDALITRPSVTAAVANSGFDSNLTSWTDADEAGATSVWVTGGYMGLTGTSTGEAAIRRQEVTVTETGTVHALDIVVERGPVSLKVGSSSGADDYVAEVSLGTGAHSLSFTPTGNFWVEFLSRLPRQGLVDSCAVAAAGVMTLTSPYAGADLSKIRWDQSADVVYLAADGYQQYKIERRGTTSYSLVKYEPEDGPFRVINTTDITMTPSALSGNITLTASRNFFKSTNAGSLFRITSTGQEVTASVSTENNFTNTIRVTGVTTTRVFTITRSGIWSATVTLQRSLTADTGPWEDVTTYTTNGTVTYDDSLDNQIAWYRIGVKTGDFDSDTIDGITLSGTDPVSINMNAHPFAAGEQVSFSGVGGTTELNGNTYTITVTDANNFTLDGTDSSAFSAWTSGGTGTSAGPVSLTLDYPSGSIDGIVRVTSYTNETTVNAEVLTALGGTDANADWYEGEWSDRYGYPTTVALDEGRLGWAGRSKVWLSVSDAYESFDDAVIGDSGPIQRTIGSGAVDIVQWMLSARNLLVGGESNEYSIRASTDENILTPTNASQKKIGTRGAGNSIALNLDSTGLFVQQGGTRLIELAFNSEWQYGSSDLTLFNPAIGEPGITHIAIQRQPDTRNHCVRSDGTVAVLLHDPAENVSCWIELTAPGTDAAIEDVAVLPGADGSGEDSVYYSVKRTVNSSTVRFLEKWSLESECQGGTTNKQMDAHITGTVSSGTLTGLTHLEGETVAVWSNGKDVGTYAVSSGQITGVTEDGSAVAGLAYTAQWQSAKLGELTQRKNISDLSVILYNTHYQGLKYGPNFTDLDDLPQTKDGTVIAADTVHSDLDQPSFSFDGHWDSDARLCLQAASPRPCTLLAAVLDLEG